MTAENRRWRRRENRSPDRLDRPGGSGQNFKERLDYGTRYLAERRISDAKTDAWILMEYAANIDRSFYYMHMYEDMPEEDAADYRNLIRRRGEHVPVQYITGEAWFYGRSFRVNPDVLIPRQDTEVLVEEVLKRIMPGMRVLDLCTGSGCILLTILKEASVSGVGADISAAALRMAELNRKRLKVSAGWIESDLFEKVGGVFDLIVSNPPYIDPEVIRELEPEVKDHEPLLALDGGSGGLDFYRRIVTEAPDYLKPGGWLCLEIGYDQGESLKTFLEEAGFSSVKIIKDLAGLDRVAVGCLGGDTCQEE